MTNPTLLLLDEPVEGLSPVVVRMLAEQVLRLKQEGLTILLSEQNLKFATTVSDRAYVIEKGVIRYEAGPAELSRSDEVLRRHLMV
jgi:branched-chain amino acid transport system ATP-binding protein